jgi:hypothetical protein
MSIEPTQESLVAALLTRVVRPRLANMTPEAARAILALRLDEKDRERMSELQAKNKAGQLAPEEGGELESYLRVGSFLDLMRAKALGSLKKADNDPPSTPDE